MNPPSRIFESNSAVHLATVILLLAFGLAGREAAALSVTAPGSGLSVRLEPTNGFYEIASSTWIGLLPATSLPRWPGWLPVAAAMLWEPASKSVSNGKRAEFP